MATRELLSPSQRIRLDELPVDLDGRLMARHHTLAEEELVAVRRRRGPANRLGFGVQLALLKFPGRAARPGERAPEKIVRYIASQIAEDPTEIDEYAKDRDTIRREHLAEIMQTFGFSSFEEVAGRELSEWLASVAASTDSGIALVEALLEEMRRRRIVVPALYAVEELAWEVRRGAREEAARRLTASLSADRLLRLDELLITTDDETRSRLVWLRQPLGEPAPKNFDKVIEKLDEVSSNLVDRTP